MESGVYPGDPRGEEALLEQREWEEPAELVEHATVKCEMGKDYCPVVQPLPLQIIERHKLTVAQLKARPRFRDYCPGEPSKVCMCVRVCVCIQCSCVCVRMCVCACVCVCVASVHAVFVCVCIFARGVVQS